MCHDKNFLDDLTGREVDVYLVSGIRLSARLESHLPNAVILQDDRHSCPMLVYKHAVSTITATG
jgi:RNA chaperone Hfq